MTKRLPRLHTEQGRAIQDEATRLLRGEGLETMTKQPHKTLAEWTADFAKSQEPLGADFAKVLDDNIGELYVTDEPRKPLDTEDALGGWLLIENTPLFPVGVELFYGNLGPLKDQHGKASTLPPYRDVRRELGYWDGETFRELGTGHSVFEPWREEDNKPTHWRPLPEPPKMSDHRRPDSAGAVAADCDKAAEFYVEKPGLSSALTDVDLYRAIARLARIIERLVNENDELKRGNGQ
jgi:hypothetical protein